MSKQHCRIYKSNDSFDKVETNIACSICFDFVERTQFTKNSFDIVAKNGYAAKLGIAALAS